MNVQFETITPKKATEYLNLNNSNRPLRSSVLARYVRDMAEGNWTECPVPISFYEEGDIADGQHRLWAVVESKQTQKFLVVRGLKRPAGLNIDTGCPRNIIDNAKISGADTGLNHSIVAIARAIEVGERQRQTMSNAERLNIVNKHRAATEWAFSQNIVGKNLRNATVLGAIGRAWYYEDDKTLLAHFCYVLSTGFMKGPNDGAAVAMRNYLLAQPKGAAHAAWRDTFLRTQNAIWSFMRRKPLKLVRTTDEEKYPLPDVD